MGIIKKFFIVTVLIIAVGSFTPVAHAQSPQDFAAAISPLPILLNAKPGTSITTDLRVNNPSAHDERFKVVIKTFSQDGPNGIVTIHDPTPADTFTNWISFDKPEFDAPPGLWQTVKMNINVPKTASLGYYFAIEFTSANPLPKNASNGTAIQGAVASFVLLNTNSGNEKVQMKVTDFTANHRFYEFLPAAFTVRLHNSGNVYAGAYGNIFIKRGSKQIAVLNINENHGLVLPGSNRVFTVNWGDGFPAYKTVTDANGQPLKDKNGKAAKKLSWNLAQVSKLRFGHYTAQLALIYNDGRRDIPINGSLSFWVIPWRMLAVLAVILLLVGLGLWSVFKRFGGYAKNQSQRIKKTKKNVND